jgi:hypothetical protein
MYRFIEKQIEKAASTATEKKPVEYTELHRHDEEEKLAFNLAMKKDTTAKKPRYNVCMIQSNFRFINHSRHIPYLLFVLDHLHLCLDKY